MKTFCRLFIADACNLSFNFHSSFHSFLFSSLIPLQSLNSLVIQHKLSSFDFRKGCWISFTLKEIISFVRVFKVALMSELVLLYTICCVFLAKNTIVADWGMIEFVIYTLIICLLLLSVAQSSIQKYKSRVSILKSNKEFYWS